MAAGPGAASGGHSGVRGSVSTMESSMDRRFQGVSNTMESIQGLSSWCIENKKHHSLVVRCWMKWLKKCELLTMLMNTHTQHKLTDLDTHLALMTMHFVLNALRHVRVWCVSSSQ